MGDEWEGGFRKTSSDGIRHKIVTETANKIGVADNRVRSSARSATAPQTRKLEDLFMMGAVYLEKKRRIRARRSGIPRRDRIPEIPPLLKMKIEYLDLEGISKRIDGFSELPQIEMWGSGLDQRGSKRKQEEPKKGDPIALID